MSLMGPWKEGVKPYHIIIGIMRELNHPSLRVSADALRHAIKRQNALHPNLFAEVLAGNIIDCELWELEMQGYLLDEFMLYWALPALNTHWEKMSFPEKFTNGQLTLFALVATEAVQCMKHLPT